MLSVAVLVIALALVQGKQLEEEVQWNAWKSYHGKTYTTVSEEAQRMAIWRNNLEVRLMLACCVKEGVNLFGSVYV